jgi:VanZ family protein
LKLLKIDKILIAWIIVVLIAIASPGQDLPDINTIPYFDKIVHIILFGLVTFLVNRSMTARGVSQKYAAILSLVGSAAYAGLAEIIQLFVPGRDCSIYDFYAGLIGALLALMVIYLMKSIQGKKR